MNDKEYKILKFQYLRANVVCSQKNVYITAIKSGIDDKILNPKIFTYDSLTGKATDAAIDFNCIGSLVYNDILVTYGEKEKDRSFYISMRQNEKIKYYKIKDKFRPFSVTLFNDDLFFVDENSIIKYSLKTNTIMKEYFFNEKYKNGVIISHDNDILVSVSNSQSDILLLSTDLDIKYRYHVPNAVVDMIGGKNEVLITSGNQIYMLKNNKISKVICNEFLSIEAYIILKNNIF